MTSELGLVSFESVLKDAEDGVDAMLLLSGGLDSAYVLWKYAQIVKDRKINCHHFRLNTDISERYKTEKISVDNQIKYIDANVSLIETEIRSNGVSPIPPLSDWYLTAILSLNHAIKANCKYIVVGDDLPDSYDRQQPHSIMDERKKENAILLGKFINSYSAGKVRLCTAMEDNDLSIRYMEMPSEYQKLTFSCRAPIESKYVMRACGNCTSCIKNKNFGWWSRVGKEIRINQDDN